MNILYILETSFEIFMCLIGLCVLVFYASILLFKMIYIVHTKLEELLNSLSKISVENIPFDLRISIGFYTMYVGCFWAEVIECAKMNELDNMTCWFSFTFLGISSILWCYFSWDLKSKPVFGMNEKQITIKKIVVYTVVMIISFFNGYEIVCKELYNEKISSEMSVINATVVAGIIASDGLLSQINNYLKLKKQDNNLINEENL